MMLCFGVVAVQLVNVQYVKAPALQASPGNPRNRATIADNLRGAIYADDGETILAESVRSRVGTYDYTRSYPGGALYSQIVGFDSTYEGTAGVEYEYNYVSRLASASSSEPLAGSRSFSHAANHRQRDLDH